MNGCVWVEKYRPTNLEDVVLEPYTKLLLNNIIKHQYFPNLLFYGPPGTGKTTTIMNLIKAYNSQTNTQHVNEMDDKLIHLNASDERGVDIIRNQICNFVNSKPLFNTGLKFVILDEVDYMTKPAQQALRYILQEFNEKVRFCLICNYVSKIESNLQNEFIKVRFNQLPKENIIEFLKNICVSEQVSFNDELLEHIQMLFHSDIRSMVNYLQSVVFVNQIQNLPTQCLNEELFKAFYRSLLSMRLSPLKKSKLIKELNNLCEIYNNDKHTIIRELIKTLIKENPNKFMCPLFLDVAEKIIHSSPNVSDHAFFLLCNEIIK